MGSTYLHRSHTGLESFLESHAGTARPLPSDTQDGMTGGYIPTSPFSVLRVLSMMIAGQLVDDDGVISQHHSRFVDMYVSICTWPAKHPPARTGGLLSVTLK